MHLFEIPFRKSNTIRYLRKLTQIIKTEKYDIVHAHGNSCTLAIELLAAKMGGCKVRIAHSHNTTCEHMRVHKLLRPIFEIACKGRFACGEEAGKWLFHRKPFTIIRNGIDLGMYERNEEIRSNTRTKLGVLDHEILLGHVGLFNYQKNHEFLIDVLEDLCKQEDKFKLVCIGEGENKNNIEAMVKRKGLEDEISFTGNVGNVSDYLQAMDCFLLPSRYEGLPYVLIEAQAAGLQCFVSDKVSKEANVSQNIGFIPLEISLWCNEIKLSTFERKNDRDRLVEIDFDIRENAITIIKEYQNLISEEKLCRR
jgi:glycosyltransferase involved in cell wall biosynthesis